MQISELTLKDRVVVAPMHQYSGEAEFPTDWPLVNVGRFAAGGAGLQLGHTGRQGKNASHGFGCNPSTYQRGLAEEGSAHA
ncbi:hypothetical protein LPW26_12440 [Rhodopseudomonas sp. HC1]|uniref:hypothetical protein n=1 Tax=Rhodopseudomonas infernalis TaxID=2897386 RepID=UPI001EE8FCA3|nr:hypothetical protein [Rhodopseudomonas infernalis]MCG6205452.1 hypothetical protein [Rhodopseudomonas infernalis]